MPDYELDDAYELKTPEDNRVHYDNWSATYDDHFAEGWGYVAPARIAALFRERFDGAGPVLDIGAGTGLVTQHLSGLHVEGIDISPEMLAVARKKDIYRKLIEADLTATLPMDDNTYAGFVSCGTFTHGHVGPQALEELLRVARQDALFVTGTIASVFDGAGFGSKFAQLVAHGRITPLEFAEIDIYEGADHPHAGDKGLVAIFRKI